MPKILLGKVQREAIPSNEEGDYKPSTDFWDLPAGSVAGLEAGSKIKVVIEGKISRVSMGKMSDSLCIEMDSIELPGQKDPMEQQFEEWEDE